MYYPNYDSTGVYIHTNNVWEDRALGRPINNSAVLMSPMLGRKSEDHTNTYLYHTHFTLLHSLKTRLFINPVLNNSNPNPNEIGDMNEAVGGWDFTSSP